MDFFYGQEYLTIVQWALRGVIAYVILLLAAKALGERSISQLRLNDFIIAITLGNILAQPLSDERLGMIGSITTTIVLVVMYLISIHCMLKSKTIEKFFAPAPIPIIRNGEIIYKNLAEARITIDFLLAELRIKKIDDIKKIAVALWEPGGNISVFLDSVYQPLTPKDMKIHKSPFSLPKVIIKEGNIDINALQDIKRSKDWLIDTIKKNYNTEVKDVLLATVDSNYNIQIFLKSNKTGSN